MAGVSDKFHSILTSNPFFSRTVICLVPFAPLLGMVFIFYNYFYEVKFKRPPNTYVRNMRLLQTIM